MKVSFKFATGLVLAAGLLVASSNAAQAGEGGAAGSVSILFGAPSGTVDNVARLSSSVAVGKGFAAATSLTAVTAGTTSTSAVGSGGGFTLFNANAPAAIYTTTVEAATSVGTDQANTFVGGTPASLRPITGVTLP
jgi:hypothetical protein